MTDRAAATFLPLISHLSYREDRARCRDASRPPAGKAQALGAQALRTAVVFQQPQNQVADFSETKGAAAGRRAYRHAHDNIGQPGGSTRYFSVDFDATKN
jgi:hypothetical protein